MHTTLKTQDRIITGDTPLTINPLQRQTKKIEALLGLPASCGLTDAQSSGNFSPRPQPLKRVQGSQRIQLNHRCNLNLS
ncbi:MAG: hypothetical protein NTV57_02720 [Cyanobacteria bacterium]|nr:hypothetical protein [Cyanobacteriota bacterium]